MYIIEPCCAVRHLMVLRDAIAKGGTMLFRGEGDLSLAELLPAILTRYSETEMMLVAPSLPDQAAEAVDWWMRQQRSRRDGQGKLDVVRHLTIVADLSRKKSPVASTWIKENPFAGRLTLVSRRQDDTAILLPDFAITGPVNMRYSKAFVATATTEKEKVGALWLQYRALADAESAAAAAEKEEKEDVKASAVPLKEDGMQEASIERHAAGEEPMFPEGPAVQDAGVDAKQEAVTGSDE